MYAAAALTNVKMMSMGTVRSKTVYGNIELGIPSGLFVTKRRRMQKKTQRVTNPNQSDIQVASWCFRRFRGVCRGSGKENTSIGRVRPSLGRRESVRERV
jgi:hypothetical protein